MFLRPRCDQAAPLSQGQACLARPPRLTKTRAHDKEISGLNHTAFDLAVYASQGRSPAPTQDSLPGCWPGSAGRDWLPAGFQRKVSHFEMILLSRASRRKVRPRIKLFSSRGADLNGARITRGRKEGRKEERKDTHCKASPPLRVEL